MSGIDSHEECKYTAGEKVPAGVVQKIKLSDRVKRLEMIGKHVEVKAWDKSVTIEAGESLELILEEARKRAGAAD